MEEAAQVAARNGCKFLTQDDQEWIAGEIRALKEE